MTVADGQGGSAEIGVTVAVTDVAEAPGVPAAPTVTSPTQDSLGVSWVAPANTGPPITDYDLQYRLGDGAYTAAGHEGPGLEATLEGLQTDTPYEVQVRASNAEDTGDWSASGMGRTRANVAPVFPEGQTTRRELAENSGAGVNIGAPLSATDTDGGTLTYELGGSDAAAFALDAGSGQLATATGVAYDHERQAHLRGHGDGRGWPGRQRRDRGHGGGHRYG